MTELQWCKENAPEALKGLSDVEILNYMHSAYMREFPKKKDYIQRNMTWDEMCEKYPNKWLFLVNVVEGDGSWSVESADLIDYCEPADVNKYLLKHLDADDFERKVFTGHLELLRAGGF